MAKLVNKGYSNYFGETPVPVEILSYDNNKYAEVKLPSGEVESVKRGYIYADAQLTRRIAEPNWFILGGGSRKDYHKRHRKTIYNFFHPDEDLSARIFATKKAAVASAMQVAKLLDMEVQVSVDEYNKNSSVFGHRFLICTPEGHVLQYRNKGNRRGLLQPSYMRGYGKIMRG